MPYFKNNRRVLFLSFIPILIFCVSCDSPKEQINIPITNTKTIVVKKSDIPLIFEAPGRVTGSYEADVVAQVAGILTKRYYQEGKYVKTGTKLFQIDPEKYQLALQTTESNLAKAKAEKIRTLKEFERVKSLIKSGAVSKKTYDEALAMKDIALSNFKSASAANLDAKINLKYSEVHAPISGIIGKENITEGNLITPNNCVLTKIINSDNAQIHFSIPSDFFHKIMNNFKLGKIAIPEKYTVEISDSYDSNYNKKGTVIFTDSSEDPITSSIAMKAEISNMDHKLISGQFVHVKLLGIIYKDKITIPVTALIQASNNTLVYMVGKDSKVIARPIKVLDYVDNKVVVDSGLKEGDILIVDGILKLRPGQIVNISNKTTTGGN